MQGLLGPFFACGLAGILWTRTCLSPKKPKVVKMMKAPEYVNVQLGTELVIVEKKK